MPTPYDEMLLPDGACRHHYRAYGAWLQAQANDRLSRRRAEADSLFHRVGITFAVYGEDEGTERLIPFDVVPQLGMDARDALVAAGHPVEWHDYPMGHEVSARELVDIAHWLDARLG